MINWTEEVNKSLSKVGIQQRLTYSESVQLVIELYTKHGKSLKWFETYFFENRVSWQGVRQMLLSEGVTLRGKGGLNRERFDCPIDELKTKTIQEISETYGVSCNTVLKRRKEHGIRRKTLFPPKNEKDFRHCMADGIQK